GDYKLVHARSSARGDSAGTRLFNLRSDPLERQELAEQEPERVASMLAAYRSFVGAHGLGEGPEDSNAWEQLSRNARQQFLERHGRQLVMAGVVLVLLVGLGITAWRRRRR